MVYINNTAIAIPAQRPPVVDQLEALFTSLDDVALLDALKGPTRRGPKGHPVEALWRCFLTKYVLGLGSTAALIRLLESNPFIAQACGINVLDAIPHEATFSRFFARLGKANVLPRLKDVSRSLVRDCYANLPGFGERVSMDSTTLKGWSNGGKTPKSDPDAGWSVKQGTQGIKEAVYGYKLHLLVDSEYELPISANVSAGDVHDSQRASNLLGVARFIHKGHPTTFRPKYVLADQGYSGKELLHLVRRQYRAEPIIQINKSHKRLMRTEGPVQKTPEWKAIYAQRGSVERTFSRLKGQRSLNHITVRWWRKVTTHCYLAVIAMQATAVSL